MKQIKFKKLMKAIKENLKTNCVMSMKAEEKQQSSRFVYMLNT